jgi:hypothetical protein
MSASRSTHAAGVEQIRFRRLRPLPAAATPRADPAPPPSATAPHQAGDRCKGDGMSSAFRRGAAGISLRAGVLARVKRAGGGARDALRLGVQHGPRPRPLDSMPEGSGLDCTQVPPMAPPSLAGRRHGFRCRYIVTIAARQRRHVDHYRSSIRATLTAAAARCPERDEVRRPPILAERGGITVGCTHGCGRRGWFDRVPATSPANTTASKGSPLPRVSKIDVGANKEV